MTSLVRVHYRLAFLCNVILYFHARNDRTMRRLSAAAREGGESRDNNQASIADARGGVQIGT